MACKYEDTCKDYPLCRGCGKYKKTTNADRIRAMSDEALAEFLYSSKFCDICEESCGECRCNGDCKGRLTEWLKQPAEEETT